MALRDDDRLAPWTDATTTRASHRDGRASQMSLTMKTKSTRTKTTSCPLFRMAFDQPTLARRGRATATTTTGWEHRSDKPLHPNPTAATCGGRQREIALPKYTTPYLRMADRSTTKESTNAHPSGMHIATRSAPLRRSRQRAIQRIPLKRAPATPMACIRSYPWPDR